MRLKLHSFCTTAVHHYHHQKSTTRFFIHQSSVSLPVIITSQQSVSQSSLIFRKNYNNKSSFSVKLCRRCVHSPATKEKGRQTSKILFFLKNLQALPHFNFFLNNKKNQQSLLLSFASSSRETVQHHDNFTKKKQRFSFFLQIM